MRKENRKKVNERLSRKEVNESCGKGKVNKRSMVDKEGMKEWSEV